VLLGLAYLGVTNALALLRLIPMSDSAKDAQILALRHQIRVLERHLHGEKDPVRPYRPDVSRRPAAQAAPRRAAPHPAAGTPRHRAALAPRPDHPPARGDLPPQACPAACHRAFHPHPGAALGPREQRLGPPTHPRSAAGAGYQGRRIHGAGDPHRRRHRPGTAADITADIAEGAAFLPAQAQAIIAADFFQASTLSGARPYLLAIIKHATRRVRVLGATTHPSAAWVAQAARNLAIDIQDARCQAKYLIRDRDSKYPALFDAIRADTAIAVVLSGVQIPRTNSIMKRWIQTCRHELLDRTLIRNQTHLLHALREYERHYNAHRPHRGIANARPLRPLPPPITDHRSPITDQASITHLHIPRRDRLGGLLNEYEHAA
jgi:hypothetical protein